MTETKTAARKGRIGAAALMLALASGLSACVQYASSDPGLPTDTALRHPIVVGSAPTTLDLYPVGGALDARTRAELGAFADRYRRLGSGEIVILTTGRGGDAQAAEAVRRALVSAGAPARVAYGYRLDEPNPPPVRVAFLGLKAQVPTPCGQWPDDLVSGSSLQGWKNEHWANFGCATQATIAAQVDDPRDFIQARPLGPADVAMRTRAITNVREGKDPGTTWTTNITPIGSGVGGN